MARGFVYLVAVVDWFSRKVLAWRLSIALETAFCIEALNEAIAHYGKPEIINTDQGSQFTSIEFIKMLKDAEIAISMDGKGAWRDNVFVERLCTIKYEEVYLRAYESTGCTISARKRKNVSSAHWSRLKRPSENIQSSGQSSGLFTRCCQISPAAFSNLESSEGRLSTSKILSRNSVSSSDPAQ